MRKIMGHHSPGTTRAEDVKDPVEDLTLGMKLGTATQGERRGGQEGFKDFPLVFSQTGRILTHPGSIIYISWIVQINYLESVIFKTASKVSGLQVDFRRLAGNVDLQCLVGPDSAGSVRFDMETGFTFRAGDGNGHAGVARGIRGADVA